MLEFAVKPIRFYNEIRSFVNSRKSKQMKQHVESETYFRNYYYRWVAVM